MKHFDLRLLCGLALLPACSPDSPATTATDHSTPAATPPQEATPPGEPCRVLVAGLTFTRSLNEAAQSAVVQQQRLTLRSAGKRDYFNDPDGKTRTHSAPVLLTQLDNRKPFTFTAKVTPGFQQTYDAGALYLYLRPDWWQKLAFERDERARTRIVSVRTIGTSDDNNHEQLTDPSVFMKISSDTKVVGFYYSRDGRQWELTRLYKNDYPATIWLGVSSQSPTGTGMQAHFDECTLSATSITDFRLGQ